MKNGESNYSMQKDIKKKQAQTNSNMKAMCSHGSQSAQKIRHGKLSYPVKNTGITIKNERHMYKNDKKLINSK